MKDVELCLSELGRFLSRARFSGIDHGCLSNLLLFPPQPSVLTGKAVIGVVTAGHPLALVRMFNSLKGEAQVGFGTVTGVVVVSKRLSLSS